MCSAVSRSRRLSPASAAPPYCVRVPQGERCAQVRARVSERGAGPRAPSARGARADLEALLLPVAPAAGGGGLLGRVDVGVENGDEGGVEPARAGRLADAAVQGRQLAGAEQAR